MTVPFQQGQNVIAAKDWVFIYTDDMMIWRHNDVIEKCDLQTDFVSD